MKTELMQEREERLIASNKKAYFDFFIIQVFEAGIALLGTEVKSLRQGKCSIKEAYCTFPDKKANELYLVESHISPYDHGSASNHKPKRRRKLLLHEHELAKLRTAIEEKGMTIVPIEIYFSGHLVKIRIAIVKAKKKYDKRETTKQRETEREIHKKYKA